MADTADRPGDPGAPDGEPAEIGDVADDGWGAPPGWERRLSRGTKARRASSIAAALALGLFVTLGGPAASLAAVGAQWDALRVALTPPPPPPPRLPRLAATEWLAARLPWDALADRAVSLAPAPADPNVAYACWVGDRHDGEGTVNLAATANAARSWAGLAPPPGMVAGARCGVVADALAPQRLLLETTAAIDATCAQPRVAASADRGASWRALAPPAALRGACGLAFASVGGELFAWSAAAQATGGPMARLFASADGGAMWRPFADPRWGTGAVSLVAAHGDGSLLVQVAPAAGGDAPGTLWCRAAGATTWLPLGPLPAATARAYASTDPRGTSGCRWDTLYAAGFQRQQAGDTVEAVATLAVSTAGGWRALPALPIDGAVPGAPLTADGGVVGLGPAGMLLVIAPSDTLRGGFSTGGVPAHDLWGWLPGRRGWLRDFETLPPNSSLEGVAWDHRPGAGGPILVLWAYALNSGSPAFTGILRATLAGSAAAGD